MKRTRQSFLLIPDTRRHHSADSCPDDRSLEPAEASPLPFRQQPTGQRPDYSTNQRPGIRNDHRPNPCTDHYASQCPQESSRKQTVPNPIHPTDQHPVFRSRC